MSEGILVSQPVPASGETRRVNPVVRLLGRTLTMRRGQIGLALLALAVVAAVAGPHLAPFGVDDFVGAPFQPPDGDSLFGTDNLGRDVLSRALAGGGGLLWMSTGATLIAMVFGTAIGLIAGQSRGHLDGLLMRAMDVILAFPERVLVLLCVAIAGAGGLLLMVSVGLVFMPAIARASRAVTLDVAHKEFVQYAEAIGMPRRQILMREILPNILTPLMVEAGFRLTWAMGLIAGINFLGFGVQPPTADWGMMINENRDGLLFQPWAVGLPIICIGFVIFGANLLADAVARAAARIEG